MGNQPGKIQNQNNRPKKNVHWKSAERPTQPGRPILVPASEEQPDVVTLHWERPYIDGGSPITGYIVEHRRMGSPHWVRATPVLVQGCEVKISGLEPGWRYQFRVFAENIVGRSDPSELSDALTVTLQRNAITVPRFVNELQDLHAVEDERIEFRVNILGQPTPEINWFKDSYEIFSSRRTKIVNDNESSVLIIHQVALTDEGEIKCTATNRAGHVATRAKLFVEAPPRIRLPRVYEDGIIVEADETLRLKVGIAGQPMPEITWLYEGEAIQNGGRNEITASERNSLLKVVNIQRSDRGEYSVKAVNKLGVDIASFLVTVTSRPSPPGKVQLKISLGKSATLSWTVPDDDGGCMIGNYIVEYFRIGWNVWLKAATTRSLTVTLNDLIEGSEYKFRVKAENPYGVSDPSQESEILFLPDAKRGITKPKSKSDAATQATQIKDKAIIPQAQQQTLSSKSKLEEQKESVERKSKRLPTAQLRNQKPKPQLVDDENLHLEMSYGASNRKVKKDTILDREVSTRTSTIDAKLVNEFNKPKLSLHFTPTSRLSPSVSSSNQSPRSILPTPKSPLQTLLSNNKNNLIENQRTTPNVNEGLQLTKNAPAVAIAIATSHLGESNAETTTLLKANNKTEVKISPPRRKDVTNVAKLAEETTKITTELPTKTSKTPRSPDDKHDEVYTSNEFMLVVFDKHSSVNGKEKRDSFDFDMEDALSPPPISISSPDLASLEYNNLHIFPLRRSVSSTEILYERAMARFYEAVESEEAGKNVKAKSKLKTMPEPKLKRETQRLEDVMEDEMIPPSNSPTLELKIESEEQISIKDVEEVDLTSTLHANEKSLLKQESVESTRTQDFSYTSEEHMGSDYTESTVSSDNDSIEKFKQELIMRTRSPSPLELETYHPRNMSAGVYIPNMPVHQPIPNIMPKSILKQSSNENTIHNKFEKEFEDNLGISPSLSTKDDDISTTTNIQNEKSNNDLQRFDMKTLNNNTATNAMNTNTTIANKPISNVFNDKQKPTIQTKETPKQADNTDFHAIVDHYSELVQQVSQTHKYHKPIYLDSDELKRVAEQADREEPDDVGKGNDALRRHSSTEEMDEAIVNALISSKPRLSISERGQLMHVRDTASNLALKQQLQQRQLSVNEDNGTPPLPPTAQHTTTTTTTTNDNSDVTIIKTTSEYKPDSNNPRRIIKRQVITTRSRNSTPAKFRSPDKFAEDLYKRLEETSASKAINNITDNNSNHSTAADTSMEENQEMFDGKPDQLNDDETHKKVRSTLSYYSDVMLFFLACYIYLFKDVRLVLPILALIVYRHLDVRVYVPNWLFFRKK